MAIWTHPGYEDETAGLPRGRGDRAREPGRPPPRAPLRALPFSPARAALARQPWGPVVRPARPGPAAALSSGCDGRKSPGAVSAGLVPYVSFVLASVTLAASRFSTLGPPGSLPPGAGHTHAPPPPGFTCRRLKIAQAAPAEETQDKMEAAAAGGHASSRARLPPGREAVG